jgi:hypothetical protein
VLYAAQSNELTNAEIAEKGRLRTEKGAGGEPRPQTWRIIQRFSLAAKLGADFF